MVSPMISTSHISAEMKTIVSSKMSISGRFTLLRFLVTMMIIHSMTLTLLSQTLRLMLLSRCPALLGRSCHLKYNHCGISCPMNTRHSFLERMLLATTMVDLTSPSNVQSFLPNDQSTSMFFKMMFSTMHELMMVTMDMRMMMLALMISMILQDPLTY